MKDVQRLLRKGDPAAGDDRMQPGELAYMRRQILDAARQPDVVRTPWQQPLAVAAMVALTIAAGIVAGQRLEHLGAPSAQPSVVSTAEPAEERRQLQFSTPGGTRIIWVFDPEFHVKETVP